MSKAKRSPDTETSARGKQEERKDEILIIATATFALLFLIIASSIMLNFSSNPSARKGQSLKVSRTVSAEN